MKDDDFRAYRTLRPGVARVEAQLQDFAYPPHSHEHVCVGLVRDGEHTSRYGLHRYTISKGDVILVNSGEVHDGQPSGWRGRRYTMLEIDPEMLRRIHFEAVGRDWVEFQQPVLRNPEVYAALSTWLTCLNGTDAPAEREASTMLLGLLSAAENQPPSQRIISDLAAKVSRRLRESDADADGIDDLATEIGASRYQLIRAFKKAFGLTPEDFRRQLRVQRARSLLAGRSRLADIAADAGFADQSHMTREFRRLIGLTPGAYRQAFE